MSTDSHDETKSCKTSARSEEENAFDVKRIKKERSDICVENGDTASITAATSTSSVTVATAATTVLEKRQPPAGRFASNGFHGDGDQLQDLVATKFATLANHGASSKQDKIRIMIEDGISEESRALVDKIFSQVEQLKIEEKLLLYLKLPLLLTNPSGTVDPLRQPLNPLGNRYEIHQTIMWIKTHLEEDPDVSLPKQEVYDEYNMYCIRNSMKPLSTADFGKVMKQVYPRVRPRRLGTRGNSRYCYAGMRKRIKLDPPTLPKISGSQTEEHLEENITEEMLGAASILIREWAEKMLGPKFPNLSALARHLVDNFCVDTRSLAAVCILSASDQRDTSFNKEVISDLPTPPISGKPIKLREAQLQLQRKLQQREYIKDQKHRCPDSIVQSKEKSIDSKGNISKGCKKIKSNQSPQVYNRQKKVSKSYNQQQQQQQTCNVSQESNCDNLVVQSRNDRQNNSNPRIMLSAQRDVKGKNSRKRANNPIVAQQEPSPEKQTKLTEESPEHSNALLPKLASIQRGGKISVILASSKSIKYKAVETADSQLVKNCDIDSSKSCSTTGNIVETSSGLLTRDQIRLLQDTPVFKDGKVHDIDTDALDDYLNGGNNSQEQEEELLQYFQQSSSSSSDVETSVIGSDTEQISRSDKVSQLRLILQQNLKAPVIATDLMPVTIVRQSVAVEKRDSAQKHNLILPTLLNHPNPSSTRRRVSFETNVVEHVQETTTPSVANTVPQSPNTRRRIFNFTPISPGPHSPINGRASKSNSANASPFVSPRNTPVPRSRSNLQAGSSRSRGQKTLSRSISCSVPYTIKTTDTFIVPTSSGAEHSRQVLTVATNKSSEVVLKGPPCTAFLDLTPQKQLLINYPSQENLQEVKNVYQKGQPPPPDQEITELLHASRHLSNEQLFYRSQSVPLHRMVNPVSLMSPISTQQCLSSVQNQSFNPSTSSSIAPTPVPSEYNDFGSSIGQEGTYLLDDTNFMSDEQQFLITDKGIASENINNIFTILDDEGQPNLQILSEQTAEETLNNTIVLDALPNANLNLSEEDMLDPSSILTDAGGALQKIMQSRSYPNTPLPAPVSAYTSSYTEDSNGSRSYPSTPLHTMQSQEVYQDPGEPILSSPILNSLSLQGDVTNVAVASVTGVTAGTDIIVAAAAASSNSLCRNVADLLEASFLEEADTETDDLDPLGNFDGLQDMDSLTPLFNEVTEPNR
ncbi:PREDICTED: DNA-binding protein RFX7 isoform X2 [Trachymyrmex cornetzi]|uniref:DNA-binding protein RFX7 isoform X2 n=1 Tax=Trachymyrmex cornetzi TaxID=471704 RepID=UPI00084EE6DB|nr:PREDICTED: DNA-binding protein RFX7 isoform X2 [Trachymyrmex cornetzi]